MKKLANLNFPSDKIREYVGDDLKEKYKQKNEKTLLIFFTDKRYGYSVLLDFCPTYLDSNKNQYLNISNKNIPYLGNFENYETQENALELFNILETVMARFGGGKNRVMNIIAEGENYIKQVYFIYVSHLAILWLKNKLFRQFILKNGQFGDLFKKENKLENKKEIFKEAMKYLACPYSIKQLNKPKMKEALIALCDGIILNIKDDEDLKNCLKSEILIFKKELIQGDELLKFINY